MSKVPINNETNPMVVLDTNAGATYYMRLTDAVAAVQLLARGQRVEYSWSDKTFKFCKPDNHSGGIAIKPLSAAQVAQLHLEDEA